jgi:hypothetical protein
MDTTEDENNIGVIHVKSDNVGGCHISKFHKKNASRVCIEMKVYPRNFETENLRVPKHQNHQCVSRNF